MNASYDIVIVGGRCAGAALAISSARMGARVAVLDRDPWYTDNTLSTHILQPRAMDCLGRIGIAEALRDHCAPWKTFRLDLDGEALDVPQDPERGMCCPRRAVLDGLLQAKAHESGVHMIDVAEVHGVLTRNGRVVGIEAKRRGRRLALNAPLVVGADGHSSLIAELVGAREYLVCESPRAALWAYWDLPANWRTPQHPAQGYFAFRGPARRGMFEACGDRLLLATAPPLAASRRCLTNPEGFYARDLRRDEVLGPMSRKLRIRSAVRCVLKRRNYLRQATGPGWALIGDAGHAHDFMVGDGITQALLDAEDLSKCLATGNPGDLTEFWRMRDRRALPIYEQARVLGHPEPIPEITRTAARWARAHTGALPCVKALVNERRLNVDSTTLRLASYTIGQRLRDGAVREVVSSVSSVGRVILAGLLPRVPRFAPAVGSPRTRGTPIYGRSRRKLQWVVTPVVMALRWYQWTLMLRLIERGAKCYHHPHCSDYAILALQRYGLRKGLKMSWRRLVECGHFVRPLVDYP